MIEVSTVKKARQSGLFEAATFSQNGSTRAQDLDRKKIEEQKIPPNPQKSLRKKASFSPPQIPAKVAEAFEIYNLAADKHGWSRCVERSPARIGRLEKRLDEIGGTEKFQMAMDGIAKDDFLMGRRPGKDGKAFQLTLERLLSTDSGNGDVLARGIDMGESQLRGPWWMDDAKVSSLSDAQWRELIVKHANGTWPVGKLSPCPRNPKCRVPKHILAEDRLAEKYDDAGLQIHV